MLAAAANGSQQCTGRRRTYSISGDSTASLVGGVLAYERCSPHSGAFSDIQHGALAKRVPRSATGGGTTRVHYITYVCFIIKPGFLNKAYFVYESKLLVLLLHRLIYLQPTFLLLDTHDEALGKQTSLEYIYLGGGYLYDYAVD
ncbi:unnamed protein product [Arctia plantaginis]|uniref:Uncharacterized protein n=1 Tax=Arctia plantaginis TaxID=874455 RepID=A0A8S1A203_ARCPL|nr:unnamed protein product [Arctia plantaginis]